MPVDFAGPGFRIEVLVSTQEGRLPPRFGTSTLNDELGQTLQRMRDVSERVTSFVFEDGEKQHDVLKLTVENTDLYFLDHPAWVAGNLVRFSFGYPGRRSPPRVFVIDAVTGFEKLKIVAKEKASLLNKAKCRLFKNATRSEVIQDIISRNPSLGVTKLEIESSALTTEGSKDWQQPGISDWEYIRFRLADKIGYEAYIEGDTLHFHKRKFDKPPVRRYVWRGGNGHLLKFDIREMKFSNRAASVSVASHDPVEGKAVRSTGSNSETSRKTTGNQSVLVIKDTKGGDVIAGHRAVASPGGNAAQVKNEADALYRRQGELEAVAMAEIIGDPLLLAKSIIEITAISKLLSGKFYIESITHTIAGKAYTCKMKLVKNALKTMPKKGQDTLDKKKAQENTQGVVGRRELNVTRVGSTGSTQVILQRPPG